MDACGYNERRQESKKMRRGILLSVVDSRDSLSFHLSINYVFFRLETQSNQSYQFRGTNSRGLGCK